MKSVKAEGISFIYFTKDEVRQDKILSENTVRGAELIRPLWDKISLDSLIDMRLILYEYMRHENKYIRFLHWSDRTDLTLLDTKVEENTYTDDDFKNSLITVFGKTFHRVCNWEGYTLVLHRSDVYAGRGELELMKIRDHKFYNCPKCGGVLSQPVVKIFDWPIDSST